MKKRAPASAIRAFCAQLASGWRRFRGIQLRGADLRGVHANSVDLHGANLRYACMIGADLRNTNLSGADLRGADLRGADLHSADLRGADLSDARLDGVTMREAWIEDDTLALLAQAEEAHYTGVFISLRHQGLADLADLLPPARSAREERSQERPQ